MYEWSRCVCLRVHDVVNTPRRVEQALLRTQGHRSSSGAGSGHGSVSGSVASSVASSTTASSTTSRSTSSSTIGSQSHRQSTQFLDQLRMHAPIRLALPPQSMLDETSLTWVDDDHVDG
jgi:hypothetical protein